VIAPPRRAVTRFFIPMIDVLILLFCIFLLMPFVSAPEGKDDSGADAAPPVTEVERLQRELAMAQRRLAEAQADKANLFDRYRVSVLEIDAGTGRLFQLDDAGTRKEIATAADAERFIQAERARAGTRDVGILMLYPRDLSGYPVQDQVEAYRKWFRGVPHAFDNPGATRE
jgi:hypothetical protein